MDWLGRAPRARARHKLGTLGGQQLDFCVLPAIPFILLRGVSVDGHLSTREAPAVEIVGFSVLFPICYLVQMAW